MKRISGTIALAVAGAFASPGLAQDITTLPIYTDGHGITLTAEPVGGGGGVAGTGGPVLYSNMDPGPNGFVSFGTSAVGGVLGTDDYVSISAADFLLDGYKFVGGVTNAGEVLFFNFFDNAQVFVDGFGVQFPSGGNFIWTIDITTPFLVPAAGIVQTVADDGSVLIPSSGEWFLGDAGPTIGSEDPFLFGAGDGQFSHNFELISVPAPGALALLGLAGLASRRRRRS